MKKYTYRLTFVCLLFITTECVDLQKDNPNAPTETSFYKTQQDAIYAINAAYSTAQKLELYSSNLEYVYDLRADDMEGTGNLTKYGDFPTLEAFTLNSTFSFGYGYWRFLFEGVFRCNILLDKVEGITFTDASRKQSIIGEAKFLRGFYYYHLVNNFGDVPLFTSAVEQSEVAVGRTPKAQVYDQIISDWQDATTSLPTAQEWGKDNAGRASKGAAQAFLGKLFLFLGRYQEAKNELGEVISSGQYSLVKDYYSNFTEENENNLESVFEIQYAPTPGDVWSGGQSNDSGSEGNLYHFLYGNPQGGSGWNIQPSDQLVNEFEPGDPRKDATVYYQGGVDFIDGDGKPKPWDLPVGQYGNRKYFKNSPTNVFAGQGTNIRVMRYSDVLLMYAETLLETGSPLTEVLGYINQVRARVGMPDYPTAEYPANTAQEVFQILMHERMVEFGGEQLRWLDLVRWDNNGKIDMTPFVKTPTNDPDRKRPAFNKAIHKVLPIPQQELDINPKLGPQNPGY